MKTIPIIQYLPLTRPKAVKLFLKRLDNANVMSILDLEDSAQDPFSNHETIKLKANARPGLDMISKQVHHSISSRLYIRINSVDSPYYDDDIQSVINAYENGLNITGVFVPKVENYSCIKDLHQQLSLINKNVEIVPMIETTRGMANLHDMLKNDKEANLFTRIHYGHFDYCLDAEIWPFKDPYHSDFWEIIKPIAQLLLNYNKTYIHTPFPFPADEDLFWSSSFYLQALFPSLDLWICTLNSELSISKQPVDCNPLKIIKPNTSKSYLIKEAKKICYNFLDGRANKRSFAVSGARFIPPHQYFAAKNYLKDVGED